VLDPHLSRPTASTSNIAFVIHAATQYSSFIHFLNKLSTLHQLFIQNPRHYEDSRSACHNHRFHGINGCKSNCQPASGHIKSAILCCSPAGYAGGFYRHPNGFGQLSRSSRDLSVGPSRRTDRLTKLSKTKGRLILYTCKVVETAEVRRKGVSGVKGGQSATN
jgi:hypothetical protein